MLIYTHGKINIDALDSKFNKNTDITDMFRLGLIYKYIKIENRLCKKNLYPLHSLKSVRF